MSRKVKLPFESKTMMNHKELDILSKQKGTGLLNIIKKTFSINNKKKNITNNGIQYMRASQTKDYYESKTYQKGGMNLKDIIFPTGLSGATATLGLIALQHAMTKRTKKRTKK